MARYIFKTTASMKPHNNKNWWIDGGIIPEKRIEAEDVNQAINLYAEDVRENQYIDISRNAIKNKSGMYRDTASGEAVQVGYVITAKTEFQRDTGAWVTQYIDLWVEILKYTTPVFEGV